MGKKTKKFFTIHKNDVGREAYRAKYVQQVEQERDELLQAIQEFAKAQDWAADSWKRQPHIKRLFDLANRGNNRGWQLPDGALTATKLAEGSVVAWDSKKARPET